MKFTAYILLIHSAYATVIFSTSTVYRPRDIALLENEFLEDIRFGSLSDFQQLVMLVDFENSNEVSMKKVLEAVFSSWCASSILEWIVNDDKRFWKFLQPKVCYENYFKLSKDKRCAKNISIFLSSEALKSIIFPLSYLDHLGQPFPESNDLRTAIISAKWRTSRVYKQWYEADNALSIRNHLLDKTKSADYINWYINNYMKSNQVSKEDALDRLGLPELTRLPIGVPIDMEYKPLDTILTDDIIQNLEPSDIELLKSMTKEKDSKEEESKFSAGLLTRGSQLRSERGKRKETLYLVTLTVATIIFVVFGFGYWPQISSILVLASSSWLSGTSSFDFGHVIENLHDGLIYAIDELVSMLVYAVQYIFG